MSLSQNVDAFNRLDWDLLFPGRCQARETLIPYFKFICTHSTVHSVLIPSPEILTRSRPFSADLLYNASLAIQSCLAMMIKASLQTGITDWMIDTSLINTLRYSADELPRAHLALRKLSRVLLNIRKTCGAFLRDPFHSPIPVSSDEHYQVTSIRCSQHPCFSELFFLWTGTLPGQYHVVSSRPASLQHE